MLQILIMNKMWAMFNINHLVMWFLLISTHTLRRDEWLELVKIISLESTFYGMYKRRTFCPKKRKKCKLQAMGWVCNPKSYWWRSVRIWSCVPCWGKQTRYPAPLSIPEAHRIVKNRHQVAIEYINDAPPLHSLSRHTCCSSNGSRKRYSPRNSRVDHTPFSASVFLGFLIPWIYWVQCWSFCDKCRFCNGFQVLLSVSLPRSSRWSNMVGWFLVSLNSFNRRVQLLGYKLVSVYHWKWILILSSSTSLSHVLLMM